MEINIEGTRSAFEAMISERGVYKKLGVERSTVSTWKIYLREGKSISLEKMEEMLIKGGATVVQDKVWKVVNLQAKFAPISTYPATYVYIDSMMPAKIKGKSNIISQKKI